MSDHLLDSEEFSLIPEPPPIPGERRESARCEKVANPEKSETRVGKASGAQRRIHVEGAALRLVTSAGVEGLDGLDPESGELLKLAGSGDQNAVRHLYRAHVDRVYRHVARILGPNDADVDDVTQRVFMTALDSAASFQGRSKVSTWLLGIATRRAIDATRARSRRSRWSKVKSLVGMAKPETRVDERRAARSEAEEILQVLSPEQRTVFVLKEVEGYTLEEIKSMTGVGVSTLHARLKAARKKLDAEVRRRREA